MGNLLELILGTGVFASIGLLFIIFLNIANDFAENKIVRIVINCVGMPATLIVWGAGLVFFCVKLFDIMKLIL